MIHSLGTRASRVVGTQLTRVVRLPDFVQSSDFQNFGTSVPSSKNNQAKVLFISNE